MRSTEEIEKLTERYAMQTTKMVFTDVKAFMHHESENYHDNDSLEIAWHNGQFIENTSIDLGDHSGFEFSVFCHSDHNYNKVAVLEILSNVGEPKATSMPASEIEEGYDDQPRKGSTDYTVMEENFKKVRADKEALEEKLNLIRNGVEFFDSSVLGEEILKILNNKQE